MATTKDDTTQGAVRPAPNTPKPVTNPIGGSAAELVGSQRKPAAQYIKDSAGYQVADEQGPALPVGAARFEAENLSHITQLIKTEPALSQYALRTAIIINTLGQISHGGNMLKYPFPDFLKNLNEALTQDSGVMDLMEAALAERMGANASWIQEKMGPLAAQHMQQGAAAGSTPTQYQDWSPSDLLHQYMMGPSAGQSAQMIGTLQAEAQGQGTGPPVPPNQPGQPPLSVQGNGDTLGWAPEMNSSNAGRYETQPGA